MMEPVFRTVAMPGKLIMASPKATMLSFALGGIVFLATGSGLLTFWAFLALQAVMIVRTHRDPYFMEVRLSALRCLKTPRATHLRGNRYEP